MTAIASMPQAKVLLIDDDDQIAGSLRHYLAVQGCHVDVAVEHLSATDLMRSRAYGVIVVDPYLTGGVHMEDGKLLHAITLLQPKASIIVVTGYGSPELVQFASASKVALLSKPQSVVALSELIFVALRDAS